MKRLVASVAVAVASALLSAGCAGYQFVGEGVGLIDARYQTVAVVELENRTPEPGLGASCARALEGVVLRSGREVVPRAAADLVLDGVVVDVVERVVAFRGDDRARGVAMELALELDLFVYEGGSAEARHRVRERGLARYVAAGSATQSDAVRRGALKRACDDAILGVLAMMERSLMAGAE